MLKDLFAKNSTYDLIGSKQDNTYDNFILSFNNGETHFEPDSYTYDSSSITFNKTNDYTLKYELYEDRIETIVELSFLGIGTLEAYLPFNLDSFSNISACGKNYNISDKKLNSTINCTSFQAKTVEGSIVKLYPNQTITQIGPFNVSPHINNKLSTFGFVYDDIISDSNPLMVGKKYNFTIEFDNLNFIKEDINSTIQIDEDSTNYFINTSYYSLRISKSGHIEDLHINKTDIDFIYDNPYIYRGIHFQNLGTPVSAFNSYVDNNKLYFESNEVNWSIEINPKMFKMKSKVLTYDSISFHNLIDYSNMKNITNDYNSNTTVGIKKNYDYEDVTFESIEGSKLRIYQINKPYMSKEYLVEIHPALGWNYNTYDYYFDGTLPNSNFIYHTDEIEIVYEIEQPKEKIDLMNGLIIDETSYEFKVNTSEYRLVLTKEGLIDELYLKNSSRNVLGDKSQLDFNGIYIQSDIVSRDQFKQYNCFNDLNLIECDFIYGKVKYIFSNSSFDIVVDTRVNFSDSNFDFFFTPNFNEIKSLTDLNNMSDFLEFTKSYGDDKSWSKLRFETIEGAYIDFYQKYGEKLNKYSGFNINLQTDFTKHQQIASTKKNDGVDNGANSLYLGDSIWFTFDINNSLYEELSPTPVTFVDQGDDNYYIKADNYALMFNNLGEISELYLAGGIYNMLQEDNSSLQISGSKKIPNSIEIISSNQIQVNYTDGVFVTYTFNPRDFDLFIHKNNSVNFIYNFPFDISPFNYMSDLHSDEVEYLKDDIGDDYQWRALLFNTFNDIEVKAYVDDGLPYRVFPNLNVLSDTLYNTHYQHFRVQSFSNFQDLDEYWTKNFTISFDFDSRLYDAAKFEIVDFQSAFDNETQGSYRFKLPFNYKALEKVPLVIYLHDINGSYFDCVGNISEYITKKNDYILLCPQLMGYEENLSNTKGYHFASLKSQLDVIESIKSIISTKDVNESDMHIIGSGVGGSLGIILGAKYPDLFSSVTTWNLATNMTELKSDAMSSISLFTDAISKMNDEIGLDNKVFEYERRSPISYISSLNNTPIHLIYNESDSWYHRNYSIDFYNLLNQKGYQVNISNTYVDSLDINKTPFVESIDWIKGKTKNSTTINSFGNNTFQITDYDGFYFWFYINTTYPEWGKDANQSFASFSKINASLFNQSLRVSLSNVDYFSLRNQSDTNVKNVTINSTHSTLLEVNNYSILLYNNSTVKYDNNYNLFSVISESGFQNNKYIDNKIYVYNSTCSMNYNYFNQSQSNSSFSYDDNCLVHIKTNDLLNSYNIFNNGSILYQGNETNVTVRLNQNGSLILVNDILPPSFTYEGPTPANNYVDLNKNPIFNVSLNVSEFVKNCSLYMNSDVYIMNVSYRNGNYFCQYNTSDLTDNTTYNYYVLGYDRNNNFNFSSSRNYTSDWNNPPKGRITISNVNSQTVYTTGSLFEINFTSCYDYANCNDTDFDPLNYTIVVNNITQNITNRTISNISLLPKQNNVTIYVGDFEFYYPDYRNASTFKYIFYRDENVPDFNMTSPANNSDITVDPLLLAYDFEDESGISNCTYYLNMDGNKSCNIMLNQTQGYNNLTVILEDFVGFKSNRTINYFVDSISPNVSIVNFNSTDYTNIFTPIFNISINDTNTVSNCSIYKDDILNKTNLMPNLNNYFNLNLSVGNNNIKVYCYDEHGNFNFSESNITFDQTIPEVNITFPLNRTYSPRYSLVNFTYEDNLLNKSCNYYLNSIYYNCSVPINMTKEGENNISIEVSDLAGNINTTNITFYIDSIIPSINFVVPTIIDGAKSNKTYLFINTTFNKDIDFANLEVGSINYTMQKVNLNPRSFSYNLTTVLDNTTYTYRVYYQDTFGNKNMTVFRNATLDWNNAPNPFALVSPSNGGFINNRTINFSWGEAFDSDHDDLNYTLDVNGFKITTNKTNYTHTVLMDGMYFWNVTVTDGEFTTSSITSQIFTVDTEYPNPVLIEPSEYNYSVNQVMFVYDSDEFVTAIYNKTNDTFLFILNNSVIPLDEGLNNVTFRFYDLAMNLVNFTRSYFVDSIKPNINITNLVHNASINNTVFNLTLNITDANNNYCDVYRNGLFETNFSTKNEQLLNYTISGINEYVNYSFECFDVFLLNSTSNFSFTFDTIIPSVVVTSPISENNYNHTNITLNFTSSENSTCQYDLNGITHLCNSTNLTIIQGRNNLVLDVKDISGNLNRTNLTFYVDSINPILLDMDIPDFIRTNKSNFDINMSFEEISNLTCHLFLDGELNQSSYFISDNNITNVSFNLDLKNSFDWNITCFDNLLNSYNKSDMQILFNNNTPTFNLFNPLNNSKYNNRTILFDYTSDKVHNCTYSVNQRAFDNCTPMLYLDEGQNNITIKLKDLYGNVITSKLNISIDSIKPNVTINFPKVNIYNTTGGNFTLNYTVLDNSSIISCELIIKDNDLLSREFDIFKKGVNIENISTFDGYHNYSVRCLDSYDNYGSSENYLHGTDFSAPFVNISGFNLFAGEILNLYISDYNLTESYIILDGIKKDLDVSKTYHKESLDTLFMTEGEHNLTIYARDHNGFETNITRTFNVTLLIIYMRLESKIENDFTNNRTIELSTNDDVDNIIYTVNGNLNTFNGTIKKGLGNHTLLDLNLTQDGEQNITITFTNALRNEGQINFTFMYDSKGPEIEIINIGSSLTQRTHQMYYKSYDLVGIDKCIENITALDYFGNTISHTSRLIDGSQISQINLVELNLVNAQYNISYECSDLLGTSSIYSKEFTVDLDSPEVANLTYAIQPGQNISFFVNDYMLKSGWYHFNKEKVDLVINETDMSKFIEIDNTVLNDGIYELVISAKDDFDREIINTYNITVLTENINFEKFETDRAYYYDWENVTIYYNISNDTKIFSQELTLSDSYGNTTVVDMLNKSNATFELNYTGLHTFTLNIVANNSIRIRKNIDFYVFNKSTSQEIKSINNHSIDISYSYNGLKLDTNNTNSTINVTLPDADLDISFHVDSSFEVVIPSYKPNASSVIMVDKTPDDYNTQISNQKENILSKLVFTIVNYSNYSNTFDIIFNYSSLTDYDDDFTIYKSNPTYECNLTNVTKYNESNMSYYDVEEIVCNRNENPITVKLPFVIDTDKKIITSTITSFSEFILTQIPPAKPSSSGESNSGGGGGSGSSGGSGGFISFPDEKEEDNSKRIVLFLQNSTIYEYDVKEGDQIIFTNDLVTYNKFLFSDYEGDNSSNYYSYSISKINYFTKTINLINNKNNLAENITIGTRLELFDDQFVFYANISDKNEMRIEMMDFNTYYDKKVPSFKIEKTSGTGFLYINNPFDFSNEAIIIKSYIQRFLRSPINGFTISISNSIFNTFRRIPNVVFDYSGFFIIVVLIILSSFKVTMLSKNLVFNARKNYASKSITNKEVIHVHDLIANLISLNCLSQDEIDSLRIKYESLSNLGNKSDYIALKNEVLDLIKENQKVNKDNLKKNSVVANDISINHNNFVDKYNAIEPLECDEYSLNPEDYDEDENSLIDKEFNAAKNLVNLAKENSFYTELFEYDLKEIEDLISNYKTSNDRLNLMEARTKIAKIERELNKYFK